MGASTTAPIRKKKGLMLSAPLALFGLIKLIRWKISIAVGGSRTKECKTGFL